MALLCSGSRRPDEIVVVDNGSKQPVAPRLAVFDRYCRIRVLRNEKNIGSGRGKSMGLDAATGDLLIVMDSHMRPAWDFVQIALDSFGRWPYSVMCPWSVGFANAAPDQGCRPTFRRGGARFLPHKHGFFDIIWNEGDAPHGAVTGCILGGCYIFGRELMHYLGGYARKHLWYGYEQDQFSLRAWSAGFDCRLLNTEMPHHYTIKNKPNDREDSVGVKPPAWAIWFNRHVSMMTLWEDEARYRDVYGPLMRAHYFPHGLREALTNAAADIALTRKHIASIRRRSDDELAACIGCRHTASAEEYHAYELTHGRPKSPAASPT